MTERRYTAAEIDQMRAGIRRKNGPRPEAIWRIDSGGGGPGYMLPESAAAMESWERMCEEQLRTALLAGVDPAEYPPDPPQSVR